MRNIRSYTVPKISDILLRTSVELNIFDSPLYLSRNDGGLAWDQAVVKRIEDIIVAGAMLLVTSPFFLIIAFLIWNTDKGPIFYTQERLTKDGKIFRIYKFRTMIVDAEKEKRTGKKAGRKRSPYSSGRAILTRNAYGRASAAVKHPQRRYEPGRTETGTAGACENYHKNIPEFEYRLKVKKAGTHRICTGAWTLLHDQLRQIETGSDLYPKLLDLA